MGRSFSGGVWGMLTSPARLKSSSKSEASEEDTTLRVKIEVSRPPPKTLSTPPTKKSRSGVCTHTNLKDTPRALAAHIVAI